MKFLKSLLIAGLLFGLVLPPNIGASSSKVISEKKFKELIEDSNSYKNLKVELAEGEFFETTPANEAIGRVARYEIEYGHSEENLVKISSYLTFTYDYETGKFEEFLIDYSKVYEEKKILIHNFTENTLEEIDVSQNEAFISYIDEINVQVEEELSKQESAKTEFAGEEEMMALSTVCWQCTKYESSPHDRSAWCDFFFSVGCGGIAKSGSFAGWLLCSGVQGVACWIPAYKICVSGQWMTSCPIAS